MDTIYDLTNQMLEVLSMALDEDADEQAIRDTFEGLEGSFEEKCDGYAKVMKELEGKVSAIDEEAKRLTARKKTIQNNIDRMKATMQACMEATGKTKFKTDLFSYGIRKNPASLKIDDKDKVPFEYWTTPEPVVNTSALKEFVKTEIEAGREVEYAHLEQGTSLSIK